MKTNQIDRLKEDRNIPQLIQLLSNDDIEIQKNIIKALGDIKAKEAVEELLPLLEDQDPHVRLEVSRSLGDIGDPRAVHGLIQSITDKEHYVRWNSAEALGKIGDSRAIESLIKALKDRNKLVRKDAAKALSRFTENQAIKALEQYQQSKEGHADSTPGKSQMEKNKQAEAWLNAFVSGVVSGVIFAVARAQLEGVIAFMVPAFALGFFIMNKNFGFSVVQKIIAIGLMFVIGMYWKVIGQAMFA